MELGGSFRNLDFASVELVDRTTVTAHVYGNLTQVGQGTITLGNEVLQLNPEPVHAIITVIPNISAAGEICLVERKWKELYINPKISTCIINRKGKG